MHLHSSSVAYRFFLWFISYMNDDDDVEGEGGAGMTAAIPGTEKSYLVHTGTCRVRTIPRVYTDIWM